MAFLEGGRNTSLDIAQFINGVLSTEFGDGVLVSSDKGWVESIVYKNTGVEVSIGGGRIPTSEGRRRGAVVPDLVIHLDKDPKVGTFLAPISWNLNRQTRYPKLIVHMGTPSHWNVGYEGKFLIGLSHGSDFEEFGMAPISPETAIEYAKRFYQGKEGGFLSGIRYERWKDKVNIEFNFDPQGGLTEIVVTPIYMPK